MDQSDARQLLESTHTLPASFTIKVIGHARDAFAERAMAAARAGLDREIAIEHSVRDTPNGKHVAVTMMLVMNSADEVMAVYQALRELEGLTMLL